MVPHGSNQDDHIIKVGKGKLELYQEQDHVHGFLKCQLHVLLAELHALRMV